METYTATTVNHAMKRQEKCQERKSDTNNLTTFLAQRLKRNKLKKKKIPRPLNAFFIFANKNRAKLKMMFPEKSNREISIELGQIWQKLTVVDRTPYHVESKKAVIQHKIKYPDYSYIPGSPKVKKKNMIKTMRLINFAKDINVPKTRKESSSVLKRKCISTSDINPNRLKKSEPMVQIQDSNCATEPQFESSLNQNYIFQSSNDPLMKTSTINIPQIHPFVNSNHLTAVPKMPWVPWATAWQYLPVPAPQSYTPFPTSTINTLYPYMYNQQFLPGPGYLWPSSTSLPCFYSRDLQMNDNSSMPIMNNPFLLENPYSNQAENVCVENTKYSFSSDRLNSDILQEQIDSGISSTSNIETMMINPNVDWNYQPEAKNEEDIHIDVISP